MKITDPLPRSVAWLTRLIGYSLGAVAIAIALYFAGQIRLVQHYTDCLDATTPAGRAKGTALTKAKDLVACVDGRISILEEFAFSPVKKLIASLPSTPCRYVGVWSATRPQSTYTSRCATTVSSSRCRNTRASQALASLPDPGVGAITR